MSYRLWKNLDVKSFGNYELFEFLVEHGAMAEEHSHITVTLGDIRHAPAHYDGLMPQDIEFLESEIAQFAPDTDDETVVETYELI